MIILKILFLVFLYLLLFLLGLLLLLLVSPIKGRLILRTGHLYFKGSYCFGIIRLYLENSTMVIKLFGFRIHRQSLSKPSNPAEDLDEVIVEEPQEELEDQANLDKAPPKKKKKKKSFKRPTKEIILLTLKLIKKLIRRISPRYAYFKLKLGLDDPYYTGLTGLIYSVLFYPLNRVPRYDFTYESVYHELSIDYDGDFYVNFSIIQVLGPIIRFIFRKPIRQYLGLFQLKKNKDTA